MGDGNDRAGHVVRGRVYLAEAVQVAAGLSRASDSETKNRNEKALIANELERIHYTNQNSIHPGCCSPASCLLYRHMVAFFVAGGQLKNCSSLGFTLAAVVKKVIS